MARNASFISGFRTASLRTPQFRFVLILMWRDSNLRNADSESLLQRQPLLAVPEIAEFLTFADWGIHAASSHFVRFRVAIPTIWPFEPSDAPGSDGRFGARLPWRLG